MHKNQDILDMLRIQIRNFCYEKSATDEVKDKSPKKSSMKKIFTFYFIKINLK